FANRIDIDSQYRFHQRPNRTKVWRLLVCLIDGCEEFPFPKQKSTIVNLCVTDISKRTHLFHRNSEKVWRSVQQYPVPINPSLLNKIYIIIEHKLIDGMYKLKIAKIRK